MAWIVADSFDYYGSSADIARSVWDSASGVGYGLASGGNTRFGSGQSFAVQSGGQATVLSKTVGSNESTIYLVFAFYRPGALTPSPNVETNFQLRDGVTTQCTVCLSQDGSIALRSGGVGGTVLATYAAAFAQDVWTHFQIRVVIDPTSGSLTVRKNGAVSDTFTATGLNTRGGTANSYANVVTVSANTINNTQWLDDVLVFSGSGAAPNTWVGDVRALCLAPVADTAVKAFTSNPATITVTFGAAGGGNSLAMAPNTVYFSGPYTTPRTGPLVKVNFPAAALFAGYTGHILCGIYANDGPGGAPGTLLGTSAAVTNITTAGQDFTFATPVPAPGTQSYYICYLLDATWGSGIAAPGSGGPQYWTLARTYGSGFPVSATGAVQSGSAWFVPGIATVGPANAMAVAEAIANGDTDYVSDSTVNDTDLYDLANLPTTGIQSIIGVVSKLYWKKSDAGLRNGQLQVKSGATTVTGPDTVLSSTYTYMSRADAVDPATSAAWTVAGVNALQIGQKVTA